MRSLPRCLLIVFFAAALLQGTAYADDCSKPSLGGINYTPDETGHGTLTVDYSFSGGNTSVNWLQFRVDGVYQGEFRAPAQSGTLAQAFSITCWNTGTHLIELRAVECSGWDDPRYETWTSKSIDVDSTPKILNLSAVVDEQGLCTLTVDYDFPNTEAANPQRWIEYRIDGGGWIGPFYMQDISGTFTNNFGTDCSLGVPPGRHRIDVLAVACNNTNDPSYDAMDHTSFNVQRQPTVTATLDPNNVNLVNVSYFFPGTTWYGQRTLRLELLDGTPASGDVQPSQIRGVVTFPLGCTSQKLKAVAIACGDTRAESPIDADARAPEVTLDLRRADLDPASQNRTIVADVTWDMHGATQPWSLQAEILSWKDADGTSYGGLLLWQKTATSTTGSESFTFVPPTKAQQLTVRLTGQSCAGTAMKDRSIDCGSCAAGTSNPVYFSDGNMRLTDFDPLPPIAGRRLTRTYNSDEQVVALFGLGWTTLFERRLIVNAAGTENDVSIVTESGDVVTFRGSGSAYRQIWPSARRQDASLTYDSAAGTYTMREAGSTDAAVFSATSGRLVVLRDLASGHEAQIGYNAQGLPQSLTDSWSGVSWTITTDAQRRLVTSIGVSSRLDLVWTYIYDADRNLTSVVAPGSSTWRTYAYAANRMTASYDAAGNLIESHTYDANGYAVSSTGSVDEIASIQFNLSVSSTQRTTRVTEKNGATTDYVLAESGGAYRPVQIIGGCASCGMHNRTFVHDTDGRVIREQAADGYVDVTTYNGDQVGSVQHRLKPVGCDPLTDPNQCRMDSGTLKAAALETTSASWTATYEYGDTRWPEKPTSIVTPSVAAAGKFRSETFVYHPISGVVASVTTSGWAGEEPTPAERGTSTSFYGDAIASGDDGGASSPNAPAFDPGGTFQSAWLALAQPSLVPRNMTGPRGEMTQFVYYPVDASAPADLRGRLAAVKDALGHISRTESYDVFGNVSRAVDANGVATEMTYDALGRLQTTTLKAVGGCDTSRDPLCATDLTTTRTYTPAAGPLGSEQRPAGGVTVYTYDSRGRIHTMSRGPLTSDLREQLELTYDPDTGQKSLERRLAYQNGSWTEKTREAFAYDLNRQLQTLTHADGTTIGYTHDSALRLASVRDENHTTANTFYSYDAGGRLATVKQTLSTAASGFITTQYAYDVYGNLTAVTDPNGNVTQYRYDDFGQMVRQDSPVTGTTHYGYDEGGNLTSSTDANGMTTQRTYDALNRIVAATSSVQAVAAPPPPSRGEDAPPPAPGTDSETVRWSYDDASANRFGIGRLGTMTDPVGTTTYEYERRGLLTRETRTLTSCLTTRNSVTPCNTYSFGRTDVTAYGYDQDGNRSTIAYPSGQLTVTYTFDYADRPTSAAGIATGTTYLPFGPLTQLQFANGTTETFAYDTRYRMSDNDLRNGQPGTLGLIAGYGYAYDNAGNVTQIVDKNDPDNYQRRFTYDDLNRLLTANTKADTPGQPSPLWGEADYSWDAMGNILRASLAEVEPGGPDNLAPTNPKRFQPPNKPVKRGPHTAIVPPLGRVMSFAYSGTTPVMRAITLNDLERSVTRDAAGNEVKYVVTRTYSPRNLLREVIDDSDPGELVPHELAYGYDGRGVRVARAESPSNGAGTVARRSYVYSRELQLLSMTREDGINVWGGDPPSSFGNNVDYEIVWFGGRPIAQIAPGATPLYTFADHLGTPLLQTDATGTITWRVEYEPFGNVYMVREGNRTDQQLRFPGQELGMTWEGPEENYNIFRWYKSASGRYTQPDPAGFEGGVNLYAFALENPLNRFDPTGLTSYVGFPPDKQRAMQDAVAKAKAKMKEKPCCYPAAPDVYEKLEKATFIFKPGLQDCGYVSPTNFLTNKIQIGPAAFTPDCCSLESTLAHEANHLRIWGTEKSSYALEKKCFGCGTGSPP
jgi:RHS repeat-associated protein